MEIEDKFIFKKLGATKSLLSKSHLNKTRSSTEFKTKTLFKQTESFAASAATTRNNNTLLNTQQKNENWTHSIIETN